MKIIKEQTISRIKITVFQWNNKFLIKYEIPNLEQTYKIAESEVDNPELIFKMCTSPEILEKISINFKSMITTLEFMNFNF